MCLAPKAECWRKFLTPLTHQINQPHAALRSGGSPIHGSSLLRREMALMEFQSFPQQRLVNHLGKVAIHINWDWEVRTPYPGSSCLRVPPASYFSSRVPVSESPGLGVLGVPQQEAHNLLALRHQGMAQAHLRTAGNDRKQYRLNTCQG